MNKEVLNILSCYTSKEAKIEELSKLKDDIDFARKILDGTYQYCSRCDDYYLTESFIYKSEKHEEQICAYEDPINSGGNEYTDGYAHIKYRICPKGHKKEIGRIEERK